MLDALYTQANGAGWTSNTGWGGASGTECGWFGITCDGLQTHVIAVDLHANSLSGSLPANLSNLTALQVFYAHQNQLTGSIPPLDGLTGLVDFSVNNNQLTGTAPSLSGLTSLRIFYARTNQLTGSIPSLAGLPALQEVDLSTNQLTGTIPSLSGLTSLRAFVAYNNQLTGEIPPLTGLTALQDIVVSHNQLTGGIPALDGLVALQYFNANNNQLTGTLPSLSGPTMLRYFHVSHNQLTGVIPSLTGLTALQEFFVDNNQLSGTIPPLSDLAALHYFNVSANRLSGPVPMAPSPNSLTAGGSALCPNYLDPSTGTANDLAWDAATGSTPWSTQCTPGTPAASATPASLAFGDQTVATTSATRVVTITNTGTAALLVGTITTIGTDSGDFAVGGHDCAGPVAPTGTCSVSLSFTPDTAGPRGATLSIFSNDPAGPTSVDLSGTGLALPTDPATPIPTLSDSALILLLLAMAGVTVWQLHQRR